MPVVRRLAACGTLTVVASLALTGCGSKPGLDKVKAQVRLELTNDGTKFDDAYVTCVADALERYATADTLSKYVKGSITYDGLRTTDKKKADAAVSACASPGE